MSFKSFRAEEEYEERNEEDCEESGEQPEEDPNEEAIRLKLSETPFEELIKLSDKLGTKLYNETIISKMRTNVVNTKAKRNENSFKRLNKNRPQEISSKKTVKQLREVFATKKSKDIERRDPRFEEQSGRYSDNVFDKTYGFLNDIRDKEMNELKKMLKKTKSEDKRQELNYLLQRMKNQRSSDQMKRKRKQLETNIRHKLTEELGTKSVKNTFVNKSTLKRLELMEKYKQLKKSGKLDKYLEKKRKRNANRERKKMPTNKH